MLERTVSQKYFHPKRVAHEIRNTLPGFNTIRYNKKEWSHYNWAEGGEEWSDSKEWKDALLKKVARYIGTDKIILEIGPGGGRWSEALAKISKELILVDLTKEAIEECRKKLSAHHHVRYFETTGSDLSFLKNNSVDFVWSFGVFVHIAPSETKNYVAEFKRVLAKGGIGIIQHPAAGGIKGGFRSSVTDEFFHQCLRENDLEVIEEFSSWGEQNQFSVNFHRDNITVFKKQ